MNGFYDPVKKGQVPSCLENVFPITNCTPNPEKNSFQMFSVKMPPQTPAYIIEKPSWYVPRP